MEAYRCDFCGELFVAPTEIDVKGRIDNKIFRSVMTCTDNGKRVDVCNGCRMVIIHALEKKDTRGRGRMGEGEKKLKLFLGIE